MPLLPRLASFWRNWFQKEHLDRELDAEMHSFLDLLTDEKVKSGWSVENARREALMEIGGIEQVKTEVRSVRIGTRLEQFAQDLRFALRMLMRAPGFAAVAILTLAIGIGANTAIFSVVRAVLLKSLPYPDADRLALIWSQWGKEPRGPASGPEIIEVRQRSRLFEEIAGIWVTTWTINHSGEPEQVRLGLVTQNFLPLLVGQPQLGRLFLPEDQRAGASPVMILSDGLWRRQFGADPSIVGKPLRIGGGSVTVVGILPRDFKLIFPDDASVPPDVQVYVPFQGDLAKESRSQGYIRMLGRLKPGANVAQAQAEVESIASELRGSFKEFADQDLHLRVVSLQGDDVRSVRPALLALFGAVGLVLLIACANVANLLLSRSTARAREITVRAALGAGASRIVRQLLTESILLAFLGGAAALGIGWAALRWLIFLRPEGIARVGTIRLDLGVLGFTAAVSLLSGIVFGISPALGAARLNLVEALKEGGSKSTSGKHRSRDLLIVSEVALGFVLLIGAGLMIRTFAKLLNVDPGFEAGNVLTFQISLPGNGYPTVEAANNFLRTLKKNLEALPGVRSVGAVSHLPLDQGLPNWYSYYWPEGTAPQDQNTRMADDRSTMPGYLGSVGATLLEGRDFQDTDDAAHAHVAIVDDELAQQTWPNQDPIGKKLSVEDSPSGPYAFVRDWVEVVGVVRHVQYHSLTRSVRPQIYLPFPLAPRPQISFIVRATQPLDALVAPVRQEVAKLDAQLPVSHVLPLASYVEGARAETRFTAFLAGALAGVALLLACIGIYGVTSHAVVQRTREIGLRMALGARRSDIIRMVLRRNMTPVAAGLFVGLGLSAALTPLLSSMLFAVRPIDVLTIALSLGILSAAAMLACYVPARRATRLDPVVALRCE